MTREAMEAMGVKVLEQEPCGDAISRQAVLELAEWFDLNPQHFSVANLIDEVENIPSVNPQEQKIGHWIRHDNGKYHWYLCSCCDAMAGSDEKKMAYKYCPNCGAKMIKPQESEE